MHVRTSKFAPSDWYGATWWVGSSMALHHIHQGFATVAAVASASAAPPPPPALTARHPCPAPFCALAAAALTASTPARSSRLDRWHVASPPPPPFGIVGCGDGSSAGAPHSPVTVWDLTSWTHPGGSFVQASRLCGTVRYNWLSKTGSHRIMQQSTPGLPETALVAAASPSALHRPYVQCRRPSQPSPPPPSPPAPPPPPTLQTCHAARQRRRRHRRAHRRRLYRHRLRRRRRSRCPAAPSPPPPLSPPPPPPPSPPRTCDINLAQCPPPLLRNG